GTEGQRDRETETERRVCPLLVVQVAFSAGLVFDVVTGTWLLFLGNLTMLAISVLFPTDHFLRVARVKTWVLGSHTTRACPVRAVDALRPRAACSGVCGAVRTVSAAQ